VNVRLRETAPGVYRIDHDPDRTTTGVISQVLVVHRLVERSVGVGQVRGPDDGTDGAGALASTRWIRGAGS